MGVLVRASCDHEPLEFATQPFGQVLHSVDRYPGGIVVSHAHHNVARTSAGVRSDHRDAPAGWPWLVGAHQRLERSTGGVERVGEVATISRRWHPAVDRRPLSNERSLGGLDATVKLRSMHTPPRLHETAFVCRRGHQRPFGGGLSEPHRSRPQYPTHEAPTETFLASGRHVILGLPAGRRSMTGRETAMIRSGDEARLLNCRCG